MGNWAKTGLDSLMNIARELNMKARLIMCPHSKIKFAATVILLPEVICSIKTALYMTVKMTEEIVSPRYFNRPFSLVSRKNLEATKPPLSTSNNVTQTISKSLAVSFRRVVGSAVDFAGVRYHVAVAFLDYTREPDPQYL